MTGRSWACRSKRRTGRRQDGSVARAIALLLFAFVVGGAAAFLLFRDDGSAPAEAPPAPVVVETTEADPSEPAVGHQRRNAIVRAAERVGPAVVTVSVHALRVVRQRGWAGGGSDFFDQFLREFFPYREYTQPVANMGSGVIIDPEGYILTNSHVVEGADRIEVVLGDGREYPAELIGIEPSYDLALLRIEGEDLPFALLGDSEDIIIGEWAIAIGNPFGYLLNNTQPSVTAGVVSAVHRDIRAGDSGGGIYKDMIQTDAAINPGNSGGPLVNGAGEVIGINTFIFSGSGGSIGVGFAIPINTAKRIVEELILYGEVRQVWVGVRVQQVTERAARMLSLPSRDGVLITYVDQGSPAEEVGIRVGDVIIAVNGERAGDIEQARRALFGVQVGDTLVLDVIRQGETLRFHLVMRERERAGP